MRGCGAGGGDQHAHDFAPVASPRMHDAAALMRRFQPERELAVGIAIERAPRLSRNSITAGPASMIRADRRAHRTARRRRPCVSATCSAGLSSAPMAAAMPPCAQALAAPWPQRPGAEHDAPAAAPGDSAAISPATPAPMMTGWSVQRAHLTASMRSTARRAPAPSIAGSIVHFGLHRLQRIADIAAA